MSQSAGREAMGPPGSIVYRTTVRTEWIDYNGHMNVAYYGLVFDLAADAMLEALDLGEAYRAASGCSVFVRESHLIFDQEVGVGTELVVTSRVFDANDRRLVLFQEMRSAAADDRIATCEVLCVHVDLVTRRSCPWPPAATAALANLRDGARGMETPSRLGRSIALSRPAVAKQG
jgi:Predicted thioesterase